MSRSSSYLADECTKRLATLIQTSKATMQDKSVYKDSLKYHLLTDPFIRVEIEGPQSFSIYESTGGVVVSNSKILAEARLADFFLGVGRVRRQYDDLSRLKLANTSNAWLLISTYYCAFFSCIELAKLFDRISLGFDSDEITQLRNKASGQHMPTFFGKFPTSGNFVGSMRADKIIFTTSGDRPHHAAWKNALLVLRTVFHGKSWEELDVYASILETTDLDPSSIRNNWNYKRADYFGPLGDRLGSEFRKLVSNRAGTDSWVRTRRSKLASFDPCAIPAICELFAHATLEAKNRGINLLESEGRGQRSCRVDRFSAR